MSSDIGIIYECVRCGHRVSSEELKLYDDVRCSRCGYKVLKKIRPPIVKRVKAE